jgi:heme exporter protein A
MPSEARKPIIQVEGLTKSFGHTKALRGVDLTVRAGEFWSIFGPNGAGKTTLIGILSTLLKPSGGKLVIDGMGEDPDEVELRQKIGVISHQTFLYGDLTAYENLIFYGRLYGVGDLRSRVNQMLSEVGLEEHADKRVRNFSRGMQQRLAIGRALLHDPTILLLDEPNTGLDQHAIRHFQNLLVTMHLEDKTILMTSHNITLGLEVCTHVAILVRGRMVFRETAENLRSEDFEEVYFQCVERGGG